MSIKSKVVLILLIFFALYALIDFLTKKLIILPSFIELERSEAQKDLECSVDALKREIYHLDSFCHDWAAWDATYEFAGSRSSRYIEINLPLSSFPNNDINLIYYYDKEGRFIWGEIYDLETMEPIKLSEFSKYALPRQHPLISFKINNNSLLDVNISGIFITELGPMLIASRPILTGNNEGPIRGSLIMGRFLGDKILKTLAEQVHVDFQILQIKGNKLPEKMRNISDRLTPQSPLIIENLDDKYQMVYTALPDIQGSPAILVSAKIPRKISSKGHISIRYALVSAVAAGLTVMILLLFLLDKTVIEPIKCLTKHTLSVIDNNDLTARISMKRKDEIGKLGLVFDRMLERLSQTTSNLRESEEMYREITEHSLAQITLVQEGKIIYANKRAIEASGYCPEELIGKKLWWRVHPEDHNKVRITSLSKLKDDPAADHYEFRYITKTDETRWIEVLDVPIVYKGEKTILGHAIDITQRKKAQEEQKRLEAKLQRAHKMEALGTLAGGVAHDLNNILSGLTSYPELLLLKVPEDSPLKKPLRTIQKSGQKATAIVQDLLTLTRRGIVIKDVVKVNDIINEYLKSPELEKLKSFYPGLKIEVNLERKLLNIIGSPIHLSKTLMNLVSNSAEALIYEGTITISTKNQYVDKPIKGYEDVEEGDYVVLTISDTGSGIASEEIEKIFEPFYTKKEMKRSGTGLGMAVVWGTMKDHNGYIDIQSVESKGTTFKLYFPATREEMPINRGEILIENYMGRGEKILIVDDVEEQIEITSQMLSRLNYTVSAVSSGEEAIEYLKTNKADLIVLDMIMNTGIDGLETYKRILEINQKQKAIIASGFSETEAVKEAQRIGAGEYIKKPFTIEKIGLAIKKEIKRL